MTLANIIALIALYLVGGGWAVVGGVVLYGAYSFGHEVGRQSRDGDVSNAYQEGKARADEWWETIGIRMAHDTRPPEEPKPKRKPRPRITPHWRLLGLKPWATAEQITAAYRKLAMKWHPDHGGSDQKMQELNRAREQALRETKA